VLPAGAVEHAQREPQIRLLEQARLELAVEKDRHDHGRRDGRPRRPVVPPAPRRPRLSCELKKEGEEQQSADHALLGQHRHERGVGDRVAVALRQKMPVRRQERVLVPAETDAQQRMVHKHPPAGRDEKYPFIIQRDFAAGGSRRCAGVMSPGHQVENSRGCVRSALTRVGVDGGRKAEREQGQGRHYHRAPAVEGQQHHQADHQDEERQSRPRERQRQDDAARSGRGGRQPRRRLPGREEKHRAAGP